MGMTKAKRIVVERAFMLEGKGGKIHLVRSGMNVGRRKLSVKRGC